MDDDERLRSAQITMLPCRMLKVAIDPCLLVMLVGVVGGKLNRGGLSAYLTWVLQAAVQLSL